MITNEEGKRRLKPGDECNGSGREEKENKRNKRVTARKRDTRNLKKTNA